MSKPAEVRVRRWKRYGRRLGVAFGLCISVWFLSWQASGEADYQQFTRTKLRNLGGPAVRPFVIAGMTERQVRDLLGEPDPGDPMFCVNAGPASMTPAERIRLTPIVLNYRSYGLIVLIDCVTGCVARVIDVSSW
jgi:hypothetical protein